MSLIHASRASFFYIAESNGRSSAQPEVDLPESGGFCEVALSVLKDLLPYRPDHLAAFLDGLRKAGLPE